MGKARCLTSSEALVEQLVPGIPDEITLDQITTKLPWKSVYTLRSVSRGWSHAVRSRQVYDARVRSHATESFIACNSIVDGNVHSTALFSWTDHSFGCVLPPIRNKYFDQATEPWGRCATLDGKVYVLGGLDCKVHVLDVAGKREWKQCANMLIPRREFGCGVIDGKIYVFGGAVNHECFWGSDLYTPKTGTWSVVRPIVALRCGHRVPSLRAELAYHFDKLFYPCAAEGPIEFQAKDADLMEIYDPIKDEWRLVEPVGRPKERMFVAGKRLYSMTPLSIHVYDFQGNLWVHLHSFSFAPVDSVELRPLGILTDDDELLAMVDWPSATGRNTLSYMVQSRGLGSQNKELMWRRPEFNFYLQHPSSAGRVYVFGKNTIKL